MRGLWRDEGCFYSAALTNLFVDVDPVPRQMVLVSALNASVSWNAWKRDTTLFSSDLLSCHHSKQAHLNRQFGKWSSDCVKPHCQLDEAHRSRGITSL